MKEYNVKELATEGVFPTGEIGVECANGRWHRNGQRLLCPLSKLILETQPFVSSWLRAAALSTGWTMGRTLAFKMQMGHTTIRGTDADIQKGIQDAKLYDILHKLSRRTNRGPAVS